MGRNFPVRPIIQRIHYVGVFSSKADHLSQYASCLLFNHFSTQQLHRLSLAPCDIRPTRMWEVRKIHGAIFCPPIPGRSSHRLPGSLRHTAHPWTFVSPPSWLLATYRPSLDVKSRFKRSGFSPGK